MSSAPGEASDLIKISTGPSHQQCQPSVQAEGQPETQTTECKAPVRNGNMAGVSNKLTPSTSDPNHPADVVNSSSSLPVVDTSVESQQIHCGLVGGQPEDKGLIAAERLLQDGYNWRKYGQKLIKGSNFTRSYYKCSFPNCQVKRQLERSHSGQITEVIYKGQHDHPKPHPTSQTTVRTVHSIQEERSDETSFSKSVEKSLNGHGQVSHGAKHNGIHELSQVVANEDDVEGADAQPNRISKEVVDDDDPECKRRRLEGNGESTPNASGYQSYETPVQVQDPAVDMVTSRARIPLEFDSDESGQKWGSDGRVQALQSDHKDTSPLLAAGRFWGDGYNWRKYGQKHIKGSEYPRSYYRCTHPNCQVKKQLERSHDGQITEVIYKGKHEHPKPQTSSHMAVGRILSIEEEKADRFSTLNSTDDKSLNGHGRAYHDNEPNGTPELALDTVNGEGSKLNEIDTKDDVNLGSKSSLKLNEEQSNSSASLNQQKSKPSVSSVKENIAVSSQELAPSVTARNPPVYMVTLRGIVPVEVESDESRQKQGLDGGVEATQSNHLGPPITDERMLENAFHWRKYGQKNIKGSEFPRSYYRCTHPNCQVKMQLERSHDGRIIEIIYKGKHDHPKPQPISRMAIGAILSIEDERSDRFGPLNGRENKSSNEHGQLTVQGNTNDTHDLSPVTASDDDVEGLGEKVMTENEPEDDNDPDSKRRKKEGGLNLAIVGRSTREPRLVVETQSEVDVVDDGYRWQKYGRKMVKGNPHPRNYYRCSNAACSVKKHVERSSHNPKAVITTYEGKHNHDPPAARPAGHEPAGSINFSTGSQATLENESKEADTISLDAGIGKASSPENRSNGTQHEVGTEAVCSESKIDGPDSCKVTMSAPVSIPNVDLNDGSGLDGNKSRTEQAQNLRFDIPSLNQSASLGQNTQS